MLKLNFIILSLIAVVCFFLGFVTAHTVENTRWVGYMVHGIQTPVEKSIIPEPSGFTPKVDGQIVLGLREDGVVVWKPIADTSGQ